MTFHKCSMSSAAHREVAMGRIMRIALPRCWRVLRRDRGVRRSGRTGGGRRRASRSSGVGDTARFQRVLELVARVSRTADVDALTREEVQDVSPEPATNFVVGYAVLAVSFVLEGVSFLRSVRQAKPAARLMERDLIEQVMATSDPTLRAVFAEDSAALIGLVIAAAGLGAHQLTGSAGPDAVGSILVGLLPAAVAIYLIDRNRELLVGEQADPRIRAAVVRALLKEPEVARVTYLRLEIVGPRIVAVIGDVDLVGDDTESHVAVRLRALEAKIAHRRWRALCSACRRPTNRRWPCDHPLRFAES
jgi:hypothetical protein